MDIVGRIKVFLDQNQISNSVFADTCGIPRPTLSQLLNGRNKKVSDEIITKVHAAYPQLSITWLMFGEGSMIEFGSNAKSTQPHRETKPSENFMETMGSSTLPKKMTIDFTPEFDSQASSVERSIFDTVAMEEAPNMVQNQSHMSTKKIAKIIVFYTDNSFESYLPTR